MTLRYLGGKSIADAVPIAVMAATQIGSLLAPAMARETALSVQIASPFTPPDPTALATALAAAVSNLTTAIAALPAAHAQAIVDAGVDLAALQAILGPARDLAAMLSGVLSAGGLHAWSYNGQAAGLGGELLAATATGLPGGGGAIAPVNALVLATESPSAWAALGRVVSVG